jgi:hypothetical protein
MRDRKNRKRKIEKKKEGRKKVRTSKDRRNERKNIRRIMFLARTLLPVANTLRPGPGSARSPVQ